MATGTEIARRTGPALDLGAAALAAAAAGFLMFAMPGALFESLVVRTGLPDYLTAAQPPLGTTARLAAVAAAALAGFAAVTLLLRGLDRIPSRSKRKADEAVDSEAPKLRRADAHPDAPARRPLLAGRELSEPVEDHEFEPAGEMLADLPAQPLPGFLVADVEEPAEEPVEAEHAEDEDALILDQPADEDCFADDCEETSDEDSIDERAFASLVSQLPDCPEEVGDDSITDLMRRLESGLSRREQAGEGADFDMAAEDEIAAAPDTPSWLAPQPRAVEADAAPATAHAVAAQPPVDEFGELSWPPQRGQNDVFTSAPVRDSAHEEAPIEQDLAPEPAPQAGESRVGHRLRAAIDEMQKTAARGG